jgi:hypothetical protein
MPLIQEIFRRHGPEYLKKFGNNMPANHKKALNAILNCRSGSYGGEVYFCQKCNEYHYSYHSCKNRHCPVCGNDDSASWISKNMDKMLPVTYFLGTFTLPDVLRRFARSHQKLFYTILFKASSDALKVLARDKKYLAADTIGMIAVLHTWSRALIYHPHVHYLIPGIGINAKDKKIRFSDDNFLIHVKPLSIIFRAKFREALKERSPQIFKQIQSNIWKQPWVVHLKPVGNGEKALDYMGRYLFRVAISNNRIIRLKDSKVTFSYTDSKTGMVK